MINNVLKLNIWSLINNVLKINHYDWPMVKWLSKFVWNQKSNYLKQTKSTSIGLQLLFICCCNCSQIQSFYNQEDENNVDNNLISTLVENTRPSFIDRIYNQTVVVGREATFQCVVNNLNKYQVSVLLFFSLLFCIIWQMVILILILIKKTLNCKLAKLVISVFHHQKSITFNIWCVSDTLQCTVYTFSSLNSNLYNILNL